MSDSMVMRRLVEFPREWDGRTAFSAALGSLTFAALRDDVLRFAAWLRAEAGLRPGDRVALCLPKSLEAMVATYGVLVAGGAYVALQHLGPPARLGSILASIAPCLLVTDCATATRLRQERGPAALPPILELEAAPGGRGFDALLRLVRPATEVAAVGPDDLAAIVFTSGSTGEPKGVMLSHRNVASNVDWMARVDRVGPGDARFSQMPLQYMSSFLFHPATAGARIHLLTDQEAMFPALIAELIEREAIAIWASTPTALRLLLENGELDRRDLSCVRLVKSHGEAPSVPVIRAAMAAFAQARFTTTYGATEALSVTHSEVPRPLPETLQTLPLGRVCDEYRMLLCDEAGNEVPAGEIGEICVIGEGVTTGYWNDPELTAAKRLAGRSDSYRTGDLAFADADGQVHFAGRKDRVVKLRGHRFDLGEVEAALKRHPAVREAIAFAVSGEGEELDVAAAVLAQPDAGLDAALRTLCAANLPRFAWPSRLVALADFPLLPGRKVDRQRLRLLLEGGSGAGSNAPAAITAP